MLQTSYKLLDTDVIAWKSLYTIAVLVWSVVGQVSALFSVTGVTYVLHGTVCNILEMYPTAATKYMTFELYTLTILFTIV